MTYGYQVDYTYNTRTGLAERLVENGSGGETIVDATEWNQAGQLTQMDYGPSAADGVAKWSYNANTLRLSNVRAGTTADDDAWQYNSFIYDNNANIELIYDSRNSGQRQCFTYDNVDRLLTAYTDNANCDGYTAVGAGNYNDAYTYDAGGNLLTKTGTGSGTHNGTYTYGDPDHAHAVTATTGGGGSSFAYDDNGNMTTRNLAGQPTQTLVWDDGQRLESLTDSSGTTEFLYGIDDTRVRRETGGTYTYYHADGTEYEHDGTTGTFTYYHRINGKTVGYTSNGTTTWTFSDQIGSTSLTRTDAGVNKIQRYTPWGEVRTDGSLTTDRHYTGQIADGSTGLNFYNARYQDPVTGRFISPDTIIPNPGNGQDYNRYSYVRNNPVVLNDPTGHSCENINVWTQIFCSVGIDDRDTDAAEEELGQPSTTVDAGVQVGSGFGIQLIKDFVDAVNGAVSAAANPVDTAGAASECAQHPFVCASDGWSDMTAPCQNGLGGAGECIGRGTGIVAGGTIFKTIFRRLNLPDAPRTTSWLDDAATARVPDGWGAGTPNRSGVGTRWTDPSNPGNGIRIDQGNPAVSLTTQQVDHVVVRHNGVVIGRDGSSIPGRIREYPELAHIPLDEWLTWSEWFKP